MIKYDDDENSEKFRVALCHPQLLVARTKSKIYHFVICNKLKSTQNKKCQQKFGTDRTCSFQEHETIYLMSTIKSYLHHHRSKKSGILQLAARSHLSGLANRPILPTRKHFWLTTSVIWITYVPSNFLQMFSLTHGQTLPTKYNNTQAPICHILVIKNELFLIY